MIGEKTVYVTKKGLAELEEELAHLQTAKRPEIIEEIQEAKRNGDWMDQTEYMLAEEELAFVDGRIQELQHMIDHAELIEPGNEDNIVNIGETVTIQMSDGEVEKYTIVGMAEADPSQGFISNESPLGQALLGHQVGERVIVHAPAGEIEYQIMAVTPRSSTAK
ncbi:MAG: transcription elongation factor GreA [Ardenticatenaceae bacterium]|nr:transcription elongation factor GreA [Anaerolineales bacterium]MCB9008028.1 transcription elongation factor GreA [Ardenticatenaceae bacterium]